MKVSKALRGTRPSSRTHTAEAERAATSGWASGVALPRGRQASWEPHSHGTWRGPRRHTIHVTRPPFQEETVARRRAPAAPAPLHLTFLGGVLLRFPLVLKADSRLRRGEGNAFLNVSKGTLTPQYLRDVDALSQSRSHAQSAGVASASAQGSPSPASCAPGPAPSPPLGDVPPHRLACQVSATQSSANTGHWQVPLVHWGGG